MPKPADVAEEIDDDVSSVGTPSQAFSEADIAIDDEDAAEAATAAPARANTAAHAVAKRRVHTRIPDDERITTNVLGIYAATALIASRATQIGRFGNALIDTAPYNSNEEVATAELLAGKCPIFVRRKVGEHDHGDYIEEFYEYHRPSEMILPKALMMRK